MSRIQRREVASAPAGIKFSVASVQCPAARENDPGDLGRVSLDADRNTAESKMMELLSYVKYHREVHAHLRYGLDRVRNLWTNLLSHQRQ
jgi:hypothetical protein